MKKRVLKPASEEVKKFIAGVSGRVEANSFEKMCLWEKYASPHATSPHRRFKWESGREGFLACVGSFYTADVYISLLVDVIDAHRYLFWYPTSLVVDHDLIDQWLKENLEGFANANRVDAQNFLNVIVT